MPALEPPHRDFADPPAEPVRLHQQLDAVAEALIGFDRNLIDDPAREQPEAVAGIGCGQPCEMVQREIARRAPARP